MKKMKISFKLLLVFALVAFVVSIYAQNPQPQQQRTPLPVSPDRQAYTEASAIKEPDKKIEALEKLIKDFPDSQSANIAQQAIFETLVKSFPAQTARIQEQANKMIAKATGAQKINLYSSLGSQLCDAGILLDIAEGYASLSLALADGELAKLKANPPPAPAPAAQGNAAARPAPNPQAAYDRSRTTSQLTLGRIYLKQGKLDVSEKNLKDALAINPRLTAATLTLAELYEKRGDTQNALDSYISAAATSMMPAPARQSLNALYAKTHKGSTAGLEEALDAKYLAMNPAPFEVQPYKATAMRTGRVVLTEVFTGSGCPPCVAADLAADLAMERYSNKDLAVIMYHEHIPQPDPMTTSQTPARFKYYAGTGVPTMVIDGATSPGGGGARAATKGVYDRITKEIEKKLEVPAEARLKLSSKLSGSTVKASVVVDKITNESPDLKLHIILVEGRLRYTGQNGVRFHPMVVRSMAGADGTGLALKPASSQTLTWDFELEKISTGIKQHLDAYEAGGHRGNTFTFTEKKFAINPKDLQVVAFVQNEKTKAILQTIILKVK
jgi:thiol-disulfide isomerase/thioredoxin